MNVDSSPSPEDEIRLSQTELNHLDFGLKAAGFPTFHKEGASLYHALGYVRPLIGRRVLEQIDIVGSTPQITGDGRRKIVQVIRRVLETLG